MATPKDNVEGTFQSTLEEFQRRLTTEEQDKFKLTSLGDLRRAIGDIQKRQENVKQMMNMTRLQSILEAMEQFGKVIEVFLNASKFVAFIWGPMKFLLQVKPSSLSSKFLPLRSRFPLERAVFCLKKSYTWWISKEPAA